MKNNKHEDPEIAEILHRLGLDSLEWEFSTDSKVLAWECSTDKSVTHKYTEIYARLLSKYRVLPQINFLEIGVLYGGSAALWSNYLPNAELIFMDNIKRIQPKALTLIDHDRTSFYWGDAYAEAAVDWTKHMVGMLDFAIDDGPHTLESMTQFLRLYLPLMNPGGTMVIEDVTDYSWFELLEKHVPSHCTVERWDISKETGRWDDRMFIVYL